MAELKTKPTTQSPKQFIESIADERKRSDSRVLARMMEEITGSRAKMWGPSIIGFGRWHYKYESGRENDWFAVGFSPRKEALTLYLMAGFDRFPQIMKKLGKFKTGKGCLYIKRLDDVDTTALHELIRECVRHMATLNKQVGHSSMVG